MKSPGGEARGPTRNPFSGASTSSGVVHDPGRCEASLAGAVVVSSGRAVAAERRRDGSGSVAPGSLGSEPSGTHPEPPSQRVAAKGVTTEGSPQSASRLAAERVKMLRGRIGRALGNRRALRCSSGGGGSAPAVTGTAGRLRFFTRFFAETVRSPRWGSRWHECMLTRPCQLELGVPTNLLKRLAELCKHTH